MIGTNYQRVNQVARAYANETCKRQNKPDDTVSEQLKSFVRLKAGCCGCEKEESDKTRQLLFDQIWPVFYRDWWNTALYVVSLSLLPFLILGGGLAFKSRSGRVPRPQGSLLSISLQDFLMKYLVAFVIVFGWLYTFNPRGQGASAVDGWLKAQELISKDTSPIFFNLTESPFKHLIVGFLGWYLYLLGYFSYRLYKSDVVSTRIYGILFRKFLFVAGVAIVLSTVSGDGSLLLIFLIATFPLSAVTLLTEYGNKRLTMGEDQTSLSVLPGISTWQVFRLEEEGIDSISALAISDLSKLRLAISDELITAQLLKNWIDVSRLISVVGVGKWEEIRGVCLTASAFVSKCNDAKFVAALAQKQVFNADEIANTLQTTFAID